MTTPAWNHFAFSAESFGKEDFFTASLASIMSAVPEARRAFLKWVDVYAQEGLVDRDWTIRAQVPFPTPKHGGAVLDMVMRSGDLELWFEHKLGAKEGRTTSADAEEVTQLVKYQRARELHEKKHQRRRVLLFYITSDPQAVDADTIGLRHQPGGKGFVWAAPDGGLRWRDLHPRMVEALAERRQTADGDFATLLFAEFMSWWGGLAGMYLAPASADLFPDNDGDRAGLWPDAEAWLKERFPGATLHNYGGSNIEVRPASGPVDYILVEPYRAERIDGWRGADWGTDVLQVAFRVPGRSAPEQRSVHFEGEGAAPMLLRYDTAAKGLMHRFFVAVAGWSELDGDEARRSAILRAVQRAAVRFDETLAECELTA